MTKARLLREIPSEEITEWMALWAIRYDEREDAKNQRRVR